MADISLLIFHLVLSNYTYKGVDLSMARKILDWNMRRYPEGVFCLFAKGRILVCQSRPDLAVGYYERMMENCQIEFRSLRNISLWELSLCSLSLYDMDMGVTKWKKLQADANWSKCAYTYAYAVCLYERGHDEDLREAEKLMSRIQGLMQRIASKTIPLEKYAARKAAKFATQGNRLMLPALELGYHFLCITRAPRGVLVRKMLPAIEAARTKVLEHIDSLTTYYDGRYYWDDYCLVHFLHAVCLRYIAHADPDAMKDSDLADPLPENAEKRAFDSFQKVIENGAGIEIDHWIVYYAHYELGRLYACIGDIKEAQKHLEMIHSGNVVVHKPEKGKYSLESTLIMRTHAAMESLVDGQPL
ncbi:uncharacterized protein EI90DRAFT_594246 [Cantharellus anzutake]|uniref:uncharacterized protein n=1 Tax=Cantharellus anzutake TaxID=1750568 RepID=UPI0019088783|nr:uncharacterized protein EI90DRAFT_594246 [Cantharellus anzutake]KAF8313293.1 hypothetical protein EI90DRAFT_594246 [Cantharellus anzutake]